MKTQYDSIDSFLTDVFGHNETDDTEWFYDGIVGYCMDRFQKTFDVMEHEGGGEGGSEQVTTVIKIIDGEHAGRFYRFNFGYYSHGGYDFDNVEIFLVEPCVVTRMEFAPV